MRRRTQKNLRRTMIPKAVLAAVKAIWTAEPQLTAESVRLCLEANGHKIAIHAIYPLRPKPRIPQGEVDPEPTRAVIRARAAELGLVRSEGPKPPYGSFVAISRASSRRGYAIAPGCVRHAWIYGVRDLERWPLREPFLLGGPVLT